MDNLKNKCLLNNAYQKFYYALVNISKLSPVADLYDNIKAIDDFIFNCRHIYDNLCKTFSKYGYNDQIAEAVELINKNTDYKELRNWRNIISHEHPSEIDVCMKFVVYHGYKGNEVLEFQSTLDNEKPLQTLLDEYCLKCKSANAVNSYFSIYIEFMNGSGKNRINVVEYIQNLVKTYNFIFHKWEEIYGCDCSKCSKIKSKIANLICNGVALDISTVWDCEYDKSATSVSVAHPIKLMTEMGSDIIDLQQVRSSYVNCPLFHGADKDSSCRFLFQCFMRRDIAKMQLVLRRSSNIIFEFVALYEDCTFRLLSYECQNKSVMYRMVNLVADMVIQDESIKAVIQVSEVFHYHESDSSIMLSRSQKEDNSFASFILASMVSRDLRYAHISFDEDLLKSKSYEVGKIKELADIQLHRFVEPDYSLDYITYKLQKAFYDRLN